MTGLTQDDYTNLLRFRTAPQGPTIRDVADYLNTRHHVVVGLVDRVGHADPLRRSREGADGRAVRPRLTEGGEDRIAPILDHLVAAADDRSAG